jgi:hypothetical protein
MNGSRTETERTGFHSLANHSAAYGTLVCAAEAVAPALARTTMDRRHAATPGQPPSTVLCGYAKTPEGRILKRASGFRGLALGRSPRLPSSVPLGLQPQQGVPVPLGGVRPASEGIREAK